MRLWKWLKLGFDQTFSGAWWKQLLWLTSVIVFFFVGMYILRPQVGISPQTESVFTSPAEQERGCPKSIWHPRFIRIPIGD